MLVEERLGCVDKEWPVCVSVYVYPSVSVSPTNPVAKSY